MNSTPTDDDEKRLRIVLGTCREPVPARFHRSFAEEPFNSCEYCRQPLRVPGTLYTISKYYAEEALRQEIAVCRRCSSALKAGYSEKSLLVLKNTYNREYVNRRVQILLQAGDGDDRTSLMTACCSLCHRPREQLAEYLEYALCEGDELIYYTHPSVVCAQCTMRLYNSLSIQTREHKRRFFQEQYGYPPPGTSADEWVNGETGILGMA
jgi:hypothetical protein